MGGVLLCVGFLQEGRPERVELMRVEEDELVVDGRQPVVDDDLLPLAAPPDPEPEQEQNQFSSVLYVVTSGQSYKALYDCNLQLLSWTDYKFAHIMSLELLFTIVKCLKDWPKYFEAVLDLSVIQS